MAELTTKEINALEKIYKQEIHNAVFKDTPITKEYLIHYPNSEI